jgi:probable F420-dependent oxidoreductase
MKIGLALPQLGSHVTGAAVRGFAQCAEDLGYDSLWVQQHLFYPHDPASGYSARPGLAVPDAYRSILAPLEVLAAVAAWTDRVTIGTSVLVAGLHRPVDLAQRLATLDLLSGGRVVAGFSVGWSDDEHVQMDVDPRTRGRRFDEFLDALEACWGPDPVEHHGPFFGIPKSDVRPKPVQEPGIRLLSGMRSPAGLRRTAARFDIWNPASGTLAEHLATLAQLNAARPPGRPPLLMQWNLFTQPPVEVANLRRLSMDELVELTAEARAAGVHAVTIDTNFDDSITGAADWPKVPERLRPVLEAAHG